MKKQKNIFIDFHVARNKYKEPSKENSAPAQSWSIDKKEHFLFATQEKTPKCGLKYGISPDLLHHETSSAVKGDFSVVSTVWVTFV